jgi:uncharacterized protein DUF3558
MRISIAVMAILLGLVTAVGCSNSEAGTPRAQPISEEPSSESAKPTTRPSSTSSESPLAEIDPCELLSDTDRAQLGVPEGKPGRVVGAETCDWQKSGDFTVGVALKPDLAFKDADLRGANPNRVDIGRHEAYRVENAGGSNGVCEVFMVTGESSFAQVTAVKRVSTAIACEKALAVAEIIEPKLP